MMLASGKGRAKTTGSDGLKILITLFVVSFTVCPVPKIHIPL